MGAPATNPYRLLPSVEEVLARAERSELAAGAPRAALVEAARGVLEGWREAIGRGELDAAELERRLGQDALLGEIAARLRREQAAGIRRVVNATGVVLHTGLGRAPLHPEAVARMAEVAGAYALLEIDRETGGRGKRDARVGTLLARLSGAEAGLAVNNNAAAVLLLLNTFAAGRETVVSRGELVEIGGSFRMPDVMERAGTALVEVGTTNRTRLADYRAAVCGRTGLLLKVHTSNFTQVGFTEEVPPDELAALGGELGLASAFDLGSGLVEAEGAAPLAGLEREPRVSAAVASGVDVVTFSGDKLLGGPQAGLVVGKRAAVEALRANPLYRALRLDKATLAALETTLELCLAGRADELPARRALARDAGDVRAEAEAIAAELAGLGYEVEVVPEGSQPGSGSAPGVTIPTFAVAVRPASPVGKGGLALQELASRLRAHEPPVFVRIHKERLLVDPRTLLPGDREHLLEAFRAAAAR